MQAHYEGSAALAGMNIYCNVEPSRDTVHRTNPEDGLTRAPATRAALIQSVSLVTRTPPVHTSTHEHECHQHERQKGAKKTKYISRFHIEEVRNNLSMPDEQKQLSLCPDARSSAVTHHSDSCGSLLDQLLFLSVRLS